ncbi:MAG: sigma 54-interacting transcriptional regulator [Pseudomonadota bacterium]|nr:sigma 54-interacting transcriptional regulator [Pseudomonadota bacterium]
MKGRFIIRKILYAGNDENFKFILNIYLKKNNFYVNYSNHYDNFKSSLYNDEYNLGIIEENIIKGKSRLFYNDLKSIKNKIPLLIITNGSNELESIFKYNENGIEIIKKPFELKDLLNKIEFLNEQDNTTNRAYNIKIPFIDKTNKTKGIFDSIYKIINNNLNTLISGENGTGKRQIANTINALRESEKKILEINFLDYKNDNFENLLLNKISKENFLNSKFLKGSEISSSILITDIDTMPRNIQKLFLTVLKNKSINTSIISSNTRFIATTSKNIKQMLSNNNFSSELFYFLSMYNIFTLPLRKRKEDIKLLVKEIISEFNLINKIEKSISEDAFPVLEEYSWPGNLTQLKNLIKRCYEFSKDESSIKLKTVIQEIGNEFKYANEDYLENWKDNFNNFVSANIRGYLSNNKIESGVYYKLLKEFEKPLIIEMLKYTNNNKFLSSQLLGINRNTLRKKMEDYEIEIIKNTNIN